MTSYRPYEIGQTITTVSLNTRIQNAHCELNIYNYLIVRIKYLIPRAIILLIYYYTVLTTVIINIY